MKVNKRDYEDHKNYLEERLNETDGATRKVFEIIKDLSVNEARTLFLEAGILQADYIVLKVMEDNL